MGMIGNQEDVRAETPMPVDSMDNSSVVYTPPAETLTFYFNDGGTKTVATGEAAGTLIYAKLAYDGVLNSLHDTIGNALDTSLVYTGTNATTQVRNPGQQFVNSLYKKTMAEKFTAMATQLTTNGDYFIDHENGALWVLAADVVVDTDTVTYSVKTPIPGSGGSGTLSDVTKLGGNDIDLGSGAVSTGTQRTVAATDDPGVALLGTIDADTSTIAGDTTSIDGKTPALGTAVMAASAPTTIATDDTQFGAVGAAADPDGNIHGQLRSIAEGVVAPIPAGTNNIGDIDVLTVPSCLQGDGNPTIDSYGHVAINLTTGADQVLVSSAADKQIWVYSYAFTCGDADGQTVSLQDEDDTALTGIMEFSQYGGISVPASGNFAMPVFKLGTDKDLEIDIVGGDVDGFLTYAIVSV